MPCFARSNQPCQSSPRGGAASPAFLPRSERSGHARHRRNAETLSTREPFGCGCHRTTKDCTALHCAGVCRAPQTTPCSHHRRRRWSAARCPGAGRPARSSSSRLFYSAGASARPTASTASRDAVACSGCCCCCCRSFSLSYRLDSRSNWICVLRFSIVSILYPSLKLNE